MEAKHQPVHLYDMSEASMDMIRQIESVNTFYSLSYPIETDSL